MKLNNAIIPHYTCNVIPIDKLSKQVSINTNYLKEKSTWYDIDGKLNYFKIRQDSRLFTELFFSNFAEKIMGLESLKYRIANVRIISKDPKNPLDITKCGLLSENFQNPNYNHYLASELLNPDNSELVCYGGYNLMSLLNFFETTLAPEDYEKNKLFLIKLFISDAFTYQVDRNPNNIAFQIPKIEGVGTQQRLFIRNLEVNPKAAEFLKTDNNRGIKLLKGFSPNVVFDNERILGVDHKCVYNYNRNECWAPLFPFSEELRFKNGEEAKKVSTKDYFGVDPNLLSLYYEFPEICTPYIERLAYGDEYKGILEKFKNPNDPIFLNEYELEYFQRVFEQRKEEFKKVLKA